MTNFVILMLVCGLVTWPVSYTHLDVYKRQVEYRELSKKEVS
ncbi:hypothetical protein A5885_001193, partial [Enterococcus sp. 8E11_MSG4843]